MDTDPRRHRTRPQLRTAVWRKTRLAVLARDHWVCQYCGVPATLVDHVVPWREWKEQGGAHNDPSNLKAACSSCNNRKKENLTRTPPAVSWRDGLPRDDRGLPTVRSHWHRMPSGHEMLIGHSQRTTRCPCEGDAA